MPWERVSSGSRADCKQFSSEIREILALEVAAAAGGDLNVIVDELAIPAAKRVAGNDIPPGRFEENGSGFAHGPVCSIAKMEVMVVESPGLSIEEMEI